MTMIEPGAFSVPAASVMEAEQIDIQRHKMCGRPLFDYDRSIFPDTMRYSERRAVAGVVAERALLPSTRFSIVSVLQGLVNKLHEDERVHWVDMGTGKGFAQQEILEQQRRSPNSWAAHVEVTGVDLLEYPVGLEFLTHFYGKELRNAKLSGSFRRPNFIKAEASEVQLPEPANLITSVFSVPYWYDPMKGLVNAYNQLTPNGLLMFATNPSYEWTRGVRYAAAGGTPEQSPIEDLERALIQADISYAGVSARANAAGEYEGEPLGKHYYSFLLRRKPGTELRLNGALTDVGTYPLQTERSDYKIAYYTPSADGSFVEMAPAA